MSENLNKKTCELCGEVLPDICFEEVEVTYKVNGRIVLNRKREICACCQSITVQEITDSDFFPDKYDEQCRLIPYDGKLGEHCPDCGVQTGRLHKNGCDREKCPVCGLQLLLCGHGDQVPLPEDEPPLKITGGDTIRLASDDELLELLRYSCKHCIYYRINNDGVEFCGAPKGNDNCTKGVRAWIKTWVKQEVKDEMPEMRK